MMRIGTAVVLLMVVIGGLIFVDARWGAETRVKVAPPAPDYLTDDVWACLQRLGVIDRSTFSVSRLPDHAEDTMVWVYAVTNHGREETRAVTIEYGFDGTGSSVVVNCWPPNEWMNWEIVPSATPYLLPEEVRNGGTPVS